MISREYSHERQGSDLRVRLITASYRQRVIASDREPMRGLTDGMDLDEEKVKDLQATHSTTTSGAVYDIKADILRSLSS